MIVRWLAAIGITLEEDVMADSRYFGTYARFDTEDKRKAADLLGADNLAGDRYDIEFVLGEEESTAWLKSRFGKLVGFLDEKATRQVSLYLAKGWKVEAYLSFVAFTEEPAPGYYWGQVALIAYAPSLEEVMGVFTEKLSDMLGDGVRPQVDLGSGAIDEMIKTKGEWFPKGREKLPEHDKKTSIVKDHRSANDKLIEKSRKGSIGCYVGSWVFLLAVVTLIIYGLKSCGVF